MQVISFPLTSSFIPLTRPAGPLSHLKHSRRCNLLGHLRDFAYLLYQEEESRKA